MLLASTGVWLHIRVGSAACICVFLCLASGVCVCVCVCVCLHVFLDFMCACMRVCFVGMRVYNCVLLAQCGWTSIRAVFIGNSAAPVGSDTGVPLLFTPLTSPPPPHCKHYILQSVWVVTTCSTFPLLFSENKSNFLGYFHCLFGPVCVDWCINCLFTKEKKKKERWFSRLSSGAVCLWCD